MAIPLYVPEEHGPVGQSTSTPTPQNINNQLNTTDNDNSGSFIYQLISDVYSLYQHYNDSNTDPSASNTGNNNDANNNNEYNNMTRVRQTRRRHPAGDHEGFQNPHQNLISLTISQNPEPPMCLPDDSAMQNQEKTTTTLFDLKLSIYEVSIGCQLRKIADSFQFEFEKNDERLRQRSKFKLVIGRLSWPVAFLAGAFVSAAATTVLLKQR